MLINAMYLVKKLIEFMEREGSLPYFQQPGTDLYPEPDEYGPQPMIPSL
jgi:hypothetical protein